MDHRIQAFEDRLIFRNSIWLIIIVALLTLVLGALLSPKL